MQIQAIHFRELKIPLQVRFRQSNNSGAVTSHTAIVALDTGQGVVGYGEACPRTYVTGESMADVQADLYRLQSEMLREPIESVTGLMDKLQTWARDGIGPSTRCAVELAWLDAWSRTQGQSLAELLGINFSSSLAYSLVLPLADHQALGQLLHKVVNNFRPPAVKLKVNADQRENLARVELVRGHFGPEVPIRVDANGGWSLDQAKDAIPPLLALGVTSVEQPVAPADLAGMQTLTRMFGHAAGIMADEALLSLEHAAYFIQHHTCNHFNLKISKLGGLFASLDIYRLAQSHGIPCQLGAHFGETSLLTSAGALLAAMTGGNLSACEGALGEFLLSADICQPSIRHDHNGLLSCGELWTTPGLVRLVHPEKLAEFAVNAIELESRPPL